MAKRKSSHHTSFLGTVEFQNIVASGLLLGLAILMFLSTREASTVGKYLASVGLFLFGEGYRYIFSPIVGILGLMIAVKKANWSVWRLVGLILFFVSVTSIIGFQNGNIEWIFDLHKEAGPLIGKTAAIILFIFLFFTSLYLTLRISYRTMLSRVRESIPSMNRVKESFRDEEDMPKRTPKWESEYKRKAEALEEKLATIQKARGKQEEKKPLSGKAIIENAIGSLTKKVPIETREGKTIESKSPKTLQFGSWDFPGVNLLNTITHKNLVSASEIEEKSILIQKTLLQFGLDVEMEGESVGPTVIQYRLRPAEGVRLSKIENLKKDLTLALKAKSIRIQAPIPGLGLVGIEVPNEKRDIVGIKELLENKAFTQHKSKLALAIGKDINGDFIVGDLAKMPHLLIAGQTWSGKSVGMNGFLLSLLYKNTPSELRMIMVDPKQVELGIYDGIPHLLTPVINSPDKALNALKWGVAEMERRYTTLKPLRVRNLEEYNEKVWPKDQMPVIVIVIDELADLMMSGNKKEVESAITRIAQKARAVGLHLIVATQRPSVDVVTGLIKANIPSRAAFTVASQVDSRTILDQIGAEDLLSRGDMLYFPTGAMASTRIQGVLVETEEVERVVNHIKRTIDPAMLEEIYDHSIIEWDRGNWEWGVGGGGAGGFEEDPKIIDEAIALVRSSGKCSTSMLQRHLRLGYARAARVVEILENMGIVSPADGSKPRDVIG